MSSKKRHSYSASFKLQVVNQAEEHGNRAAARDFDVNKSMVQKWKQQKESLSLVKRSKLSFCGRKAMWPQLEEQLEEWILQQRKESRSVSTVSIRLKAKSLADEMKISGFQGGPSWCFWFMKHHNLSVCTRTTISQVLPEDAQEKLNNFHSYCVKKIKEFIIQPRHITNMDEVPLTFDIPFTRTVDKIKTNSINIRTTGHEKTSVTVVLACQADGQKLPSLVIFKRKTIPKEKFPSNIIIKANSKGWMDEKLMIEWLKEAYVKQPDGFFHIQRSLLVFDSMRAHITDAVKVHVQKTNLKLVVIPGSRNPPHEKSSASRYRHQPIIQT